jgi:hypothetical protein
MSKSKQTPLEVVERYHEKYLQYEDAFNNDPFDEKEINNKIQDIIKIDGEIDDDKVIEDLSPLIIEKQERQRDVNNAALKFMLHADFYEVTSEEGLPANIKKDLDNLPEVFRNTLRETHSVNAGKFERNEKKVVTAEEKQYIKAWVEHIKKQM